MFNVGDKIRALPSSNGRYCVTTESNHCEGKVVYLYTDGAIEIRITKCDIDSEIGRTYNVDPIFFQKIEGDDNMEELCVLCGENHDNLIFIENYGYVCQECYDNEGDFYFCDCCECHYREQDTESYHTHYGTSVCQNCRDNHYYYCEHCNDLFYEDDVNYCERDDAYYCDDHYPSDNYNIHDYHDYADLCLLGEGDDDTLRFGLELEVNAPGKSYSQLDDDAGEVRNLLGELLYDIQSDSSIPNGFEIITQPMKWDYYQEKGKEKLENTLNYLKDNGYQQLCDGCGVHIHFTKAPVERANSKYYEELNYILETFDTKFKNIARRDTLYDGSYLGDKVKKGKKVDWGKMVNELEQIKYRRYQPINISPDHTFEWRIFRGTTDIDILSEYITMAYNTTMSVANNTFVGKTFSEITGIKDADKTRLSGIARQLRYDKLIDKVYTDALEYVLNNLTTLRDNEDQNIKYTAKVDKQEYYYTSENSNYSIYNSVIRKIIGRINTSRARITINKLIDLISELNCYPTVKTYDNFKTELENYRAKIKELQEARDNYGQKPVEKKDRKIDASMLKPGMKVTFKSSDVILNYCQEHNFGVDISCINGLGNAPYEIRNITDYCSMLSVDIGIQIIPIECIKSIIRGGV